MKIAVAVDGSENALRAAKHAIWHAKHLPDTQLEIIYVADYDKAKEDMLTSQSSEGLLLKRERKVHPVLDLAEEAKIETKLVTLKGHPSEEIIKYVNKGSIDELVLGSRGLNAFQEVVLGSVSHKVMKHVKCPVTVVK